MMPRALPSSNNTPWQCGNSPSDVAHAHACMIGECGHDMISTKKSLTVVAVAAVQKAERVDVNERIVKFLAPSFA
jgi:hypothetical protein